MKLFNKIIGACLGLTMALGTGLAISSNAKSPTPVYAAGDTATFTKNDFSGQGTSSTGSAMNATVNGVTLSTDKGFGTSEVRIYAGANLTISSDNTITEIAFTFAGGKTGGLSSPITNLSTNSWQQTLASQLRFSQCVVTFEAGGHTHTWDDGVITTAATCTEDGVKTYTCTDCGETKTEAIPAIGHHFEDGVCTVCGALEATFVEILPSDGTAVTSSDWSITKGDITISAIASTLTNDQMRVFKGKKLTITSATDNIIRFKFECTANDAAQYGPGCFDEVDGYFYSGKIGQYLGSTKSIEFTAGSNQVRITKITVWFASKANWCAAFSDVITCDASGTTQPWSDKWPMLKNAYNGLSNGDQNDLKTLNNIITGRYDYIVGKYGTTAYEDFIGRNPAPIGNSKAIMNIVGLDSANNVAIIVVITLCSLTAIAAYLMIRRKKEINN